jgi:16S rRNA (cytosine1402-N4)-methyltransferase
MMEYHVPVMLKECLEGLRIREDGIYVDATFGGGGHSKAILELLGKKGRVVAFDRDADAITNDCGDSRLKLIRANYRNIGRFLKLEGISRVDGILADLGVSSHQLDEPERGFSYRFDEALDMRMDTQQSLTAFEVVNGYEKDALQSVFSRFGEVRNARRLAAHVVAARAAGPITTTGQLAGITREVAFRPEAKYLARVFQAIRIEVNAELDALREFLEQSAELLASGGRLVVMSYHSLEDRLVKNFMKKGVFEGEPVKDIFGRFEHCLKVINRKPLEAGRDEIAVNPRARSAKLRIAEKK